MWQEWHKKIQWEEDSSGLVYTVGYLSELPVVIELFWVTLNGHRVCFYNSTSRVVDWTMIKGWLSKVCYPLWDGNSRHADTDAMNFHHCIQHVTSHLKVIYKRFYDGKGQGYCGEGFPNKILGTFEVKQQLVDEWLEAFVGKRQEDGKLYLVKGEEISGRSGSGLGGIAYSITELTGVAETV